MESLKLRRFHGILKVSGIVLCAAGVTVLALYQGPKFKSFVHHPLFHHPSRADAHPSRNWILGILLQSLAAVMFALWTVFQGPLLVEYPSMLLNTAVQVVFATVQSVFIALVMERGLSRWKLSLDVGLCRDHLLCKYMRIPSAAAANHCFIGRIVTVEVEKENLASVEKLRYVSTRASLFRHFQTTCNSG
uniref:Uncharacterized protein n=2 Tax=Avena sativa TaxID=4498 RepID=A0ACD5YW40_AVESA